MAEAAVVGRPDEVKGQAVGRLRHLEGNVNPSAELKIELRDHVGVHIGAIAKPDEVRFAEALPKTRSGKIMRRLLKEIASGKTVTGDTTTLEDFSVLAKLRRRMITERVTLAGGTKSFLVGRIVYRRFSSVSIRL